MRTLALLAVLALALAVAAALLLRGTAGDVARVPVARDPAPAVSSHAPAATPSERVPRDEPTPGEPDRSPAPRTADPPSAPEASSTVRVRVPGRVIVPAGAPAEFGMALRASNWSRQVGALAPVASDRSFVLELPADASAVRVELVCQHLLLDERPRVDPRFPPRELVLEPLLGGRLRLSLLPPAGWTREELAGRRAELTDHDWIELEATVGASGTVTFGALPNVVLDDLVLRVQGMAAASVMALRVRPGELLDASVTLEAGVAVSGVVLDESGRPVRGTEVRLELEPGGGGLRFTDAEGRFGFEHERAGAGRIVASADGWQDATLDLGTLAAGTRRDGLELVLRRGHVLRGQVAWSNGEPAAGALVEVTDPEGGWDQVITGSDGRFELTGLDGGTVHVHATGYGREVDGPSQAEDIAWEEQAPTAWARADDVDPDAGELRLVLVPGAELTGTVVDDLGAPLESFLVFVTPRPRGEWTRSAGPRGATGRFRMTLEPGRYTVTAWVGEVRRSPPVEVELPGPEARLVVPRGGSVAGRVIDLAGRPVTGAEVIARAVREGAEPSGSLAGHGPWIHERSDREGRFRLEGLAGRFQLAATHPEHGCSTLVELDVDADDPPPELELVLRGIGALEVRLHERYAERAGRTVQVVSIDLREGLPLTTDTEGRCELPDIPAGPFALWLEEAPDTVTVVEVVAGETTEVVLGAPRAPIRAELRVTRGGAPVAERPLRASGQTPEDTWIVSSPPPEPLWTVDGRTDAAGAAVLQLPLPGWIRFTVELEGGDTAEVEALVLDRPRVTLELELD